ncbi:hypothetical protein KIL84_005183, partial [Mauremys mutica]
MGPESQIHKRPRCCDAPERARGRAMRCTDPGTLPQERPQWPPLGACLTQGPRELFQQKFRLPRDEVAAEQWFDGLQSWQNLELGGLKPEFGDLNPFVDFPPACPWH